MLARARVAARGRAPDRPARSSTTSTGPGGPTWSPRWPRWRPRSQVGGASTVSAMVPSLGAVDADGARRRPRPALRRPPGRAGRPRPDPARATAASCSPSSPGTPPPPPRRARLLAGPGGGQPRAVRPRRHRLDDRDDGPPAVRLRGLGRGAGRGGGHDPGQRCPTSWPASSRPARSSTTCPAAGALVGGGTIDAFARAARGRGRRGRRRAGALRHDAHHLGRARRVGRGARAVDDPAHGRRARR